MRRVRDETSGQFVTALAWAGADAVLYPRTTCWAIRNWRGYSGLPKPTVTRLTNTLMRLGCLKREVHSGKYQLDVGVLGFGYAMLSNLSIRSIGSAPADGRAGQSRSSRSGNGGPGDRLQMVYLDVVQGQRQYHDAAADRLLLAAGSKLGGTRMPVQRRCQRASEFSSTTCANAKQNGGR